MCAIGGLYNGELNVIPWYRIWDMFDMMEERGDHAYGMCIVDADDTIHIFKAKGGSRDARLKWQWMERAFVRPRLIMMHTRWATQGSVADMGNNHPVIHEDIILTHNGCIRNDEMVWRKIPEATRQHQVDTESVSAAIHYRGIDWVGVHLRGTMSLAWIDEDEPQKLNLWTNGGNPLAIGFETKTGFLVYATWERYLEGIAGMNTMKVDTYTHYTYAGGKLMMRDAGDWGKGPRPDPVRPYTSGGRIY